VKITDVRNRSFTRTLRGYDPQEVDAYINDLQNYCNTLSDQVINLEKKLNYYESQEQNVKSTILAAEKTAETIIENARYSTINMQSQIEKKALEIISNAENEANLYRKNVYNCFFGYENELRMVLERFNNLARMHIEELGKGFSEDIKKTVYNFESEFNNIPKIDIISKNKDNL